MNKVILLGRLTKDPDLKFTAGDGKAVSKFTIAINRIKKGEADFINCVAFGKTAENIAQFFTKGKQICIDGSIRTGSYEAQDGTKRYTTDVLVETFDFIDSNKDSTSSTGSFDSDIIPVEDEDMQC